MSPETGVAHSPRGDLAITLSGGGARAAYQVGVLRALARHLPRARPMSAPLSFCAPRRSLSGLSSSDDDHRHAAGKCQGADDRRQGNILFLVDRGLERTASSDPPTAWQSLAVEGVVREPVALGALQREFYRRVGCEG